MTRRGATTILVSLAFAGSLAAATVPASYVKLTISKIHQFPHLDPEDLASLPATSVFAPLPDGLLAALGEHVVDYDSEVVAYLPRDRVDTVHAAAREHGLVSFVDSNRPGIRTPFHSFDPKQPEGRHQDWSAAGVVPVPVPGHFILQMAYPTTEWMKAELASCEVTVLGAMGHGSLHAAAQSLGAIMACDASRFLRWAGPWFTTDRVHPDGLLGGEPLELDLLFAVGADLSEELPEGSAVLYAEEMLGGVAVRASLTHSQLRGLINRSVTLQHVRRSPGPDHPSDEKQAQILARDFSPTCAFEGGFNIQPGYLQFLQGRGLRGLADVHYPTVAIFDQGFNHGNEGSPPHDPHPCIDDPVDTWTPPSWGTRRDGSSHGTAVAGIIAGESGDPDCDHLDGGTPGFALGTGIAPDAQIFSAKIFDRNISLPEPPNQCDSSCWSNPSGWTQAQLLDDSLYPARIYAGGESLIANNSWNGLPATTYSNRASLYDGWVRDAHPSLGDQPMTIVFTAGNGHDEIGYADKSSIGQPAESKNVITVGATENVRSFFPNTPTCSLDSPSPFDPNNQCIPDPDPKEFAGEDPDDLWEMTVFSGRGGPFGTGVEGKLCWDPTSAGSECELHEQRIKPDLVAPGWRVYAPAPDSTTSSDTYFRFPCTSGCEFYDPLTGGREVYTYHRGTSFAAPAVAGAAALKHTWFSSNHGVVPRPSLLKAALIATADSLREYPNQANCGASCDCPCRNGDCRPSRDYGWGLVNVDRLTDPSVERFFVNETETLSSGQSHTWQRTIDDPNEDVLIVLAWTDEPAPMNSGSLVNDLRLTVINRSYGFEWDRIWFGNNFNENSASGTGADDGYSYENFSIVYYVEDAINTVEAVFIPAAGVTTGMELDIIVTGNDVAVGTQDFALYGYNVNQ